MKLRRGARTFVRSIIASFVPLVALVAGAGAATPDASQASARSALSAEEALNQAFLTSNANALETLLADDWIVVSGFGGIAERKPFIAYVEPGILRARKWFSRNRAFGCTEIPRSSRLT